MATNRVFARRPAAKSASASPSDRDEIARVAYEFYEQRGRLDGCDVEDWLRAEAIVRARRGFRAG
jgi:hypothetical protein